MNRTKKHTQDNGGEIPRSWGSVVKENMLFTKLHVHALRNRKHTHIKQSKFKMDWTVIKFHTAIKELTKKQGQWPKASYILH